MATKRQIAEDLYKRCGALVSASDLCRHFNINKNKARQVVFDLKPFGANTGKKYFYEDVAEKILQM